MAVVNVNLENFAKEVLQSEKPVLVDFYATWCGPCMMMSPEMDEFAESTDKVKVCKIDVDESTDLAVTFGILSVPTVMLFKEGKEVDRFVGAREKDGIAEFCGL